MQEPRTTPLRIDADRTAGTVRLEWADGHATAYTTEQLRWLCPCAYCRGEAGMPGWLDSNPVLTPEQTRLMNVFMVGTYAIQPTWGDGHDSGFHSFLLLRDMCPCATCTAERDQHASRGLHAHGGDR